MITNQKREDLPTVEELMHVGTISRTSAVWKKNGKLRSPERRFTDERQLRHITGKIRSGRRSAPRGWVSLPLSKMFKGRIFGRNILSMSK